MATRFYLPNSGTPPVSPAFDGGWAVAPAARVLLSRIKTDTALANLAATVGSTATRNVGWRQYVSEPLPAGTLSGTVAAQIRALENVAQTDACPQIIVRLCDSTGGNLRTVLAAATFTSVTNEFPNATATNRRFPAASLSNTLTTTAIDENDRLVVEIGYRAITASSTAGTGTARLGDPTAGTDLPADETTTTDDVPWIEFSLDLFPTPVGASDLDTSWRVYAPVAASDLATSWKVLSNAAPERSRYFNGSGGSDQIIHFAPGGITAGARTVAVLWRPEQTQFGGLVAGRASGSEVWTLHLDTDGKYYHANDFSGFTGYVVGEWQIIAYSKPSGSAAVRWHLYRYDTAVWSHTAGSTAAAESAIDELRVGRAFGRADGEIAVVGVWNSELSDSAIGTAGLETALQSWLDLSPTALLPFNQTSIATAVEDLAGTTDETSQTGTTVVDTDVPPGFDWNLGGGTTPVGASDLTTSWQVAAQVTSDLATSWRVYQPVAATDLATSWRVFVGIGASDLTTSWRVHALVTSDLVTSWRVYTLVGSVDLASSWRVYAPTGASDLAASWRVLSALTPVASDLVTSWRVVERVTADLVTSWRVSAPVTSDLATSWRVYAPVAASDLATSWKVFELVLPVGPSDLVTSWRALGLVTRDLTTSWRVLVPPVVMRPDTGTTARADTGVITRPFTGIVVRP